MGWRSGSDGGSSERSSEAAIEWEMRPCGMLVQKRSEMLDAHVAAPVVRLRISYGANRYQVSVGSQATFGES